MLESVNLELHFPESSNSTAVYLFFIGNGDGFAGRVAAGQGWEQIFTSSWHSGIPFELCVPDGYVLRWRPTPSRRSTHIEVHNMLRSTFARHGSWTRTMGKMENG